MKLWTKLLVPVLAVALVGVAEAKDAGTKAAKKAKHDGLTGKIVSVDGTSITISHGGKKAGAKDVTVTTDNTTKITIDGEANKSVGDLKPGEKVVVTPATGTATEIKATSAKSKGNKAGKKGKKAA